MSCVLELFSRVTGFYRPVQDWNPGKKAEFSNRVKYGRPIVEITVKDSSLIKTTVVEEEGQKVEKVEVYTLADIAKGIETCDRLIAQLPLEKGHNWQHNLACVEAEKALWQSYEVELDKARRNTLES